MSNIKIDTLNKLKSDFQFGNLEILRKQVDKDVVKYLFNLSYNQEEINRIITETILTNIDYDKNNYFVKKAQIILRKGGRNVCR